VQDPGCKLDPLDVVLDSHELVGSMPAMAGWSDAGLNSGNTQPRAEPRALPPGVLFRRLEHRLPIQLSGGFARGVDNTRIWTRFRGLDGGQRAHLDLFEAKTITMASHLLEHTFRPPGRPHPERPVAQRTG